MNTRNLLLLFALALILLPLLAVADQQSGTDAVKTAPVPPPDNSSADLNRIKALEGRWRSTTSMFGKENEEVFTEYKVTAGGSAVLETIFPGTPHEMVSVYFDDDNGKLTMTHYCMMRNRPHFKVVESSENKLKFDVTKVEGVKSEDAPSMGAITYNFKDKDHFSSTCESGGDAKHDHQEPMTMHYTRVKG